MNSRIARGLLVAVALAAVGMPAVAGMSMGSGGSRNPDRDSGYYPGYGAGGRCQGGPCSRDDNRRDYGQGMRMGSGQGGPRQERQQYRQQYRYGPGGPGYGRGGQGYGPREPADEQGGRDEYQGYPRGGGAYGRGGPGYAPGAPADDQGGQGEYQGYPRGGPGYGRGAPGAAPHYRQGGGF